MCCGPNSCNVKAFGGLNIAVTVLGAVGAIAGIVLAGSDFPVSDRCGINYEDQDSINDLNDAIDVAGLATVVAGVVTIIAGILGTAGGFMKNTCSIIAAATVLSITIALAAIVAFFLSAGTTGLSDECDKRECNEFTYHCPVRGCIDWGAGTDTCRGWCKDHYDYFCEDLNGSMAFGYISFAAILIVVIVSTICACGAGCCCREAFGMAETPPPPPQAVSYGMPVGQAVGVPANNETK